MHRIRAWARAKAHHNTSPLTSGNRRLPANPPSGSPSRATQTATIPSTTSGVEPKPTAPEPTAQPRGKRATRANKNVFVRFWLTAKDVLLASYINLLLVFVPVGIAVHFVDTSAGVVFAMNAIAIIPLAGLLSHATEIVASRLGDTVGALMNVTFGNAVELIIFIIALVKNEIRIVQASLLGSILANLLLILGMCFLLGGLRFREQIYNSTVTQMSACLLSLSVTSLLLPTAFHASFSNSDTANSKVLQVSRGTSVVLLLVYLLYLLFQLKSHAYMYESTPQHIIERESVPGPAAQYFESSDSSETSSSSESDDSEHSSSNRKKIKRMIKRTRRNRKHSVSSQQASSSKATVEGPSEGVASDFRRQSTSEDAGRDRMGRSSLLPQDSVPVAGHDTEKVDERTTKRKERRRRENSRTGSRDARDADGSSLAQTQSAPVRGEIEERRVGFALAPDVEAQPETALPKPFSLRSLRPPIPRAMKQNVFTTPPMNPAAAPAPEPQVRGSARRAASLPPASQNGLYHMSPGGVPPIVPIVVHGTPKPKPSDEDSEEPEVSRTTAVVMLLVSTGLVALCAEFMVDSINDVVGDGSNISEAFIGLIILPIVGNAAEHVTSVTVAMKNKMDLAIGVALGSSIQIAIFVTPLVVILGWIMDKDMSLYFTLFETVSMFVSAFIVNFLVLDGRSNYLEGALLCAAYVIIAVAAFYYPDGEAENSALGGGEGAIVSGAKVLSRGLASWVGI